MSMFVKLCVARDTAKLFSSFFEGTPLSFWLMMKGPRACRGLKKRA